MGTERNEGMFGSRRDSLHFKPPKKMLMGVNVRRGKKPSHAMRSITIFQPSYYTYFLYPHLVDLFST